MKTAHRSPLLALTVAFSLGCGGSSNADDPAGAGGSPAGAAGSTGGATPGGGAAGQAGTGGGHAGKAGAGGGGHAGKAGAGGSAQAGNGGVSGAGHAGMAGAGGGHAGMAGSGPAGKGGQGGGGGAGAGGEGGAAAGGGSGGAAGGPPAKPPFDWVGIIGTGQSLSVGAVAGEPASVTQPYHNMKLLDSGPDPKYPLDGKGAAYSLVPLVEPFRQAVPGPPGPGYSDGQYPNNIAGESPNAGTANMLSFLWASRTPGGDYVSLHSVVGWSGHELTCLDKDGGATGKCHSGGAIEMKTTAYAGSLAEARAMKGLADAAGKSFGYGAIVLTHGETDAGNPAYGDGLVAFQASYAADLASITGQATPIPLVVSQQSTIAGGPGGSAVQVWKAGVSHPGQIVCTGPKYQYAYAADNLHMPAAGYVRIGEKYAEVIDQVVNQGKPWKPLQPSAATRSGAVITVVFDVPNPPLAWDETIPKNHQTAHTEWATGRGFEVTDGGKPAAIASVALAAPDTLVLTLAAPPTGEVTLAYAITQDAAGTSGGLEGGLHGQLRDSDDLVGHDAEAIDVMVTQNSASVTSAAPGGFARRAGRDVVTGPGLAADLIVQSLTSKDSLTLSAPFPGASGVVKLSFHHDLHNYCVHFVMPVPAG